jgi:transketolase
LGLRVDGRSSKVYVVLGDGELAEGQVWEAAMAAVNFHVDNVIAILDRNGIQATGPTKDIFDISSIKEKWTAFGWECIEVNGHAVSEIADAFDAASEVKGKPVIVIAKTVKGKGFSFAENSAAFHNGSLTEEQYQTAKRDLEKQKA